MRVPALVSAGSVCCAAVCRVAILRHRLLVAMKCFYFFTSSTVCVVLLSYLPGSVVAVLFSNWFSVAEPKAGFLRNNLILSNRS